MRSLRDAVERSSERDKEAEMSMMPGAAVIDESAIKCLWISCVAATLITVLLVLIGTFGNISVFTIYRGWQRRSKSPMNLLIMQLSAVDCVFLFGTILLQARKVVGEEYCSIFWVIVVALGNLILHISRFARNWTTVYIAASRCVAIIRPLGNINNRAISRTRKCCVFIIIASAIVNLDSLLLPYEWSVACNSNYTDRLSINHDDSNQSRSMALADFNDTQQSRLSGETVSSSSAASALASVSASASVSVSASASSVEEDEEEDEDGQSYLGSCDSVFCDVLLFFFAECQSNALSCGQLVRFALFEQGGPFAVLLILNVVLCFAICINGNKMKKHRSRRVDGRVLVRETLITIGLVTNFLITESMVSVFELFGSVYNVGRYAWTCHSDHQSRALATLVLQGSDLLAAINSGMDFFLYCWISRRFRIAFINLIKMNVGIYTFDGYGNGNINNTINGNGHEQSRRMHSASMNTVL